MAEVLPRCVMATSEVAARIARVSAEEQGLPETVEDESVLKRVAEVLAPVVTARKKKTA